MTSIENPVIDALIRQAEEETTAQELQTVMHTLDRVQLWGYSVIPTWYSHKGEEAAYHKALKPPANENLY